MNQRAIAALATQIRCVPSGTVHELPKAGGWVLEQPVPAPSAASGEPPTDLRGGYPLFACSRWDCLAEDLESLAQAGGPVALTAVPDPFGDHDAATLKRAFPDHREPYKTHYGIDLAAWEPRPRGSQHSRNARQALKNLTVELVDEPTSQLERWCELYENLVARHEIRGIATFGRDAFATQLALTEVRMLVAQAEDQVVGAVLWILDRGVATYHLAAYDDVGYAKKASFALFQRSIEAFKEGRVDPSIRYLNLGGAAGVRADSGAADGLARFKSGWSNTSRESFVCGRILDPAGYAALTRGREDSKFFPLYRAP